MERLVTHDGVEDATHGVAAAVGARDRELVVGLRQAFGVAHYLAERAPQHGKLGRIEQLPKDQVAVLIVGGALLGRRQHVSGPVVNRET